MTAYVNFCQRGDSGRAWMWLNLQDTPAELHFDSFYNLPNISFSLKTNYDRTGHYSGESYCMLRKKFAATKMRYYQSLPYHIARTYKRYKNRILT